MSISWISDERPTGSFLRFCAVDGGTILEKYRYIILGAGPAGLALAGRLLQLGERSILLLEKERSAGGLCRSVDVDGSPLDIGGGHFLDVRRPRVLQFLFSFLPEGEWDRYERDSRIEIGRHVVNSPLEANIWQLPMAQQVGYLKAIAVAGCNLGREMPEKFVDWIYWKLGERIAEDYMIPYNQKMFGEDLDALGTYWLDKLPDVSFEETLMSCLEHKAYGTQPGHAQFYYPKKYGYGEVWRRMADALGGHIHYGEPVTSVDYGSRTVNGRYRADVIVITIPWESIMEQIGMPVEIRQEIAHLRSSGVVIEYHPEDIETKAQWIYCPDPGLSYHRILVRHNFCPGAKGYWTETNRTRFAHPGEGQHEEVYFINDYAYPLNTVGKQEAMEKILCWAKGKGVIGLGRWGEWQHYNSDVVVEKALELADRLIQ